MCVYGTSTTCVCTCLSLCAPLFVPRGVWAVCGIRFGSQYVCMLQGCTSSGHWLLLFDVEVLVETVYCECVCPWVLCALWFTYLHVCLDVCLYSVSIYLYIYILIFLSIYLLIFLSIYRSIFLSMLKALTYSCILGENQLPPHWCHSESAEGADWTLNWGEREQLFLWNTKTNINDRIWNKNSKVW